jgi:CheY-like chemotaxis protein
MNRILLVEDNEMIREMLSFRLQSRGFDLIVANDGQAGIDLARSQRPNLILMDMSLPVINGWDATRMLKSDLDTRQIPILALTADDSTADRDKAIEAGCDDFDTKPVTLDRLLKKMTTLIEASTCR